MNTLIEQAAKRLAQLQQAGADVPRPESRLLAGDVAGRRPMPGSPATSEAADGAPGQEPVRSKAVDIDWYAVAAAGIVGPHATRSRIADEFRVIKRPLIRNVLGQGGAAARLANRNLIMVTSALPGEGKTFTAINLAMSLAAEMDHTVMLVDADVARPSVLGTLGLAPAPGLLDVLLDNSIDFSSVLLRTNVEKLSILPCGTQHPRATELLASDAMAKLLDAMAKRYSDRIIVFDSPPLLVTTEARVLAYHMGQVVMVVQAERTQQAQVREALAAIEACPLRLMVLNGARASSEDDFSYGYGREP